MLKTKNKKSTTENILNTTRQHNLMSQVQEFALVFYDGDAVKEKEIKSLIDLYYALPKKVPTPTINFHSKKLYLSWSFFAGHVSKKNTFNIYINSVDESGANISWNYEAHFNSTYPLVNNGTGVFYQRIPLPLQEVLRMFFTVSGHGYDR